jgi:hypothetical protein
MKAIPKLNSNPLTSDPDRQDGQDDIIVGILAIE